MSQVGKLRPPEGSLDSLALVSHTVVAVTWMSPQIPGSTCSPVTSQSLGAWSAQGAGFRIPGMRASTPSLPVSHPSLRRLGQPPLSHLKPGRGGASLVSRQTFWRGMTRCEAPLSRRGWVPWSKGPPSWCQVLFLAWSTDPAQVPIPA